MIFCYGCPSTPLPRHSILFIVMNTQNIRQPQRRTELTKGWLRGKTRGGGACGESESRYASGRRKWLILWPCCLSPQGITQSPLSAPFSKLWGWKAPDALDSGGKPGGGMDRQEDWDKTQMTPFSYLLVPGQIFKLRGKNSDSTKISPMYVSSLADFLIHIFIWMEFIRMITWKLTRIQK